MALRFLIETGARAVARAVGGGGHGLAPLHLRLELRRAQPGRVLLRGEAGGGLERPLQVMRAQAHLAGEIGERRIVLQVSFEISGGAAPPPRLPRPLAVARTAAPARPVAGTLGRLGSGKEAHVGPPRTAGRAGG